MDPSGTMEFAVRLGEYLTAGFSHRMSLINASLFSPPHEDARIVVASVLVAVCASLANSAGIGGGPFYMPLLHAFLRLPLLRATALSHAIVTSSGIASTLYGVWESNPFDPSLPLVSFPLVLALLPALLLGVSIGILSAPLLPHWLLLFALLALLLRSAHKTWQRGSSEWRRERQLQEQSNILEHHALLQPHLPVLHLPLKANEQEGIGGAEEEVKEGQQQQQGPQQQRLEGDLLVSLERVRQEDDLVYEGGNFLKDAECHFNQCLQLPWRWMVVGGEQLQRQAGELEQQAGRVLAHVHIMSQPIYSLFALWVFFLLFQYQLSRHHCCTAPFILLISAQMCLCATLAVVAAKSLSLRGVFLSPISPSAEQEERLLPSSPSSVCPTPTACPNYNVSARSHGRGQQQQRSGSSFAGGLPMIQAVVALSGVMAGSVGIGGALLFGPVLLSYGLHPQVLASTSVCTILFSSSAISLSFSFHGLLPLHKAAFLCPIAFAASLLGVLVVGRVVKRTGHTSVIIFILFFLIACGVLLVAIVEGPNAIKELLSDIARIVHHK